MIPEPTHDHAFPPTHPRRLPGDPRQLQVAKMYSRADAITDGLLVQVPPKLVDLYRLPSPLAITSTAWADAVDWPQAAHDARPGTEHRHESIEGRLADVLFLVKCSHETNPTRSTHPFTLWRIPPTQPTHHARPLRLTLTVHPGDHDEPVATLAHTPHRPPWWQRHALALNITAAVWAIGTIVVALWLAVERMPAH